MNLEELERIRKFLVDFGQISPGGWAIWRVHALAHYALQLSVEVERLQTLNNEYRQALLKSGWQEGEK